MSNDSTPPTDPPSTAPGSDTRSSGLLGRVISFLAGLILALPYGEAILAVVAAVVLAGLGIALGLMFVVAAGLSLTVAGVPITPLLSIVLSLILATGLGFGGVAVLYLRYRGIGLSYVGVRLPSLRELVYVGGGYLAALALALSATVVVSRTQVETGTNTAAQAGMENPEVLLLLIPASLLLIGPGEELLYRGVVQNRLRERFPAVVAIPFASLIFASIHYFSLSGAPSARLVSISLLVLPTLVFGAVYELTNNIAVPALIHGLYNATLFGMLYYAVTVTGLQGPAAVLF